jgi:hypothetical protein
MATDPKATVPVLPAGSRIRRLNPGERARREQLPPRSAADAYNIQQAIALLRKLPEHNLEQVKLVMRVLKQSLESAGLSLPPIIDDAVRRQGDLEDAIDKLESEIADLEGEIKDRQTETAKLDADLKETTMVRERLELAEKRGKPA